MGMINYETILSSYDDKLTLMQWLKKVEAALKNASATSFVLNKKGNATISFSIVFEDGTSLESGDIVLQQGESVQSAYIQNGHLHLVLTNGDDLDAGNMFNGNVNISGNAVISGSVSTPILTSQNEEIEAQKPVVEVMNGYSAEIGTSTSDFTLVVSYAGVCKNGNKLTFSMVGKLTKTNASPSENNTRIALFTIPNDIYAKLVPIRATWLALMNVYMGIDLLNGTSKQAICFKENNKLRFDLYNVNSLNVNTDYYFRIETTFLLSDNLAS